MTTDTLQDAAPAQTTALAPADVRPESTTQETTSTPEADLSAAETGAERKPRKQQQQRQGRNAGREAHRNNGGEHGNGGRQHRQQGQKQAQGDRPRQPRPEQQAQPGKHKAAKQQHPQQQQQRETNPVLEKLFELYPHLFGARFLPLKLGVFHDLMARHPEVFKKDELKLAMGQHARSTRYLESVAAGHARHDLEGQPVEAVAPEHVHHAILEIFRRRQARSREDLRPTVLVRLMEAIENSGLSREAYAERMRVQDETTNALLDEAIAALGLEAAKREALARAFAASGKTAAEFADMYGMDAAQVTQVVERVKRDQEAAIAAAAAAEQAAALASQTAKAEESTEAVAEEEIAEAEEHQKAENSPASAAAS